MGFSSVHNIIRRLLDLLFPPTERTQEVRGLTPEELAPLPAERNPENELIFAVCDYRDRLVREVVKAAKYDGSSAASRLMGVCIQRELLGICSEARIFDRKIVITPVPLSRKRRTQRGFNQGERIAKVITQEDRSATFETRKLLEKTRETAPQTRLSHAERRQNLKDAFRMHRSTSADTIIVIDDVTTTGATLMEARRAIKEKTQAKVIGVAFAH